MNYFIVTKKYQLLFDCFWYYPKIVY